jgi:hypothetical protein
VLRGLVEGEEIVTSGQFLIDSESQLEEAIRKMLDRRAGRSGGSAAAVPKTVFSCPMHPEFIASEAGRCPQCGMDFEERAGSPEELAQLSGKSAHRHEHGAATSEVPRAGGGYSCPMHPQVVSDEPGRCDICGMFLEKTAAAGERSP